MRSRSLLLTFALAFAALPARVAYGQAAEVKTAEQSYKNIIELKGTPADQLGAAMQFISASLGVDCAFCHVPGKFELDDKATKKTARGMIAMTFAINRNHFNGQREITCYSCHRGSTRPVNTPPALEADASSQSATALAATPGPAATVDQVLDKYVAAVGGAAAMKKITSRVAKGKVIAEGEETPIDVITQAPNRRISITHNPANESFVGFDGTAGWMGATGHPARQMTAAESASSSIDAEFYLVLRLKEMYPQLRLGRPEEINGVPCEVLTGTAPGRPAIRLYFDKNSGLLVRLARFADSPVGRNITQIDYSDYRDADGVKVPFRWTLSRSAARFTIQLNEVKSNVPVDESRFAKPAGDVK